MTQAQFFLEVAHALEFNEDPMASCICYSIDDVARNCYEFTRDWEEQFHAMFNTSTKQAAYYFAHERGDIDGPVVSGLDAYNHRLMALALYVAILKSEGT